jgi:SAM-dependent methyltransferase
MTELAILRIETTCNTSDKILLRNLRETKERGYVPAPFTDKARKEGLLICGSGPSLLSYFPIARKIYPDAHVMALNGAYNALLSIGEIPDYYVQLDARAENVNFLGSAHPKTQFLLASQCAPEIFELLSGFDVQVYHLNTPTTHIVFPQEDIYFGGGSTVGSTAMAVAGTLGYRLLGLFGYDSSYANGKSHALPQSQNEGQKTIDVWVNDREYLSTPTMAKQVEEFRPWVRTLENVFPDMDVRLFGDGLLYDYISTGQSGSPTRESEAAKYAEMYKNEDYRMPKHRADWIKEILSCRPRTSLLDVGTGRGETLEIAKELGYTSVAGTETVDYLTSPEKNIVLGLLPKLSIESNSFDTVTCFEVVEHLLPGDVNAALRELERIADKRVIISAATKSDMRAGVELHPSYRSEAEWMETFKAAWGVEADVKCIGNLSSIGLSPVYEYRLRTP